MIPELVGDRVNRENHYNIITTSPQLHIVRVTHYVIMVLDSSLARITRLPRMISGSLGFVH